MFFLRFSMVKKLNNFNFLLSILLPVLITFSLSGLWHGASWNFLLWGTLHGMYIVICYSWGIICKKFDLVFSNNNIYNIFSIILTFISVTLAFVPFRTQSMASALSFYNSGFGIPILIGRENRVQETMGKVNLEGLNELIIHNASLSK